MKVGAAARAHGVHLYQYFTLTGTLFSIQKQKWQAYSRARAAWPHTFQSLRRMLADGILKFFPVVSVAGENKETVKKLEQSRHMGLDLDSTESIPTKRRNVPFLPPNYGDLRAKHTTSHLISAFSPTRGSLAGFLYADLSMTTRYKFLLRRFVCPKFSVCRGWGPHAGTFVELLLRCINSSSPILPSLETLINTKTVGNTFEITQKPKTFRKPWQLNTKAFSGFPKKIQDRTILSDAKLNIAMLQACPIALFGSRYFPNQTIT